MTTIAIFVPLPEEMRYAYNHLVSLGAVSTGSGNFDNSKKEYFFTFPGPYRSPVGIDLYVIGDMGNLRTAIRVSPVLRSSTPNLVFLVGIAGSAGVEQANVGDVVVATRVKSFYPDKVKGIDPDKVEFIDPAKPPEAPPMKMRLDERKRILRESFFRYRRDAIIHNGSGSALAQYLRHISGYGEADFMTPVTAETVPGLPAGTENAHPAISAGVVFSSEMVIDSKEYIEFLLYKNDCEDLDYYRQTEGRDDYGRRKWFSDPFSAIDMESLGFFSAVADVLGEGSLAFSIRGISDLASKKEELDVATGDAVRRIAVENAIQVAVDLALYATAHAFGAKR